MHWDLGLYTLIGCKQSTNPASVTWLLLGLPHCVNNVDWPTDKGKLGLVDCNVSSETAIWLACVSQMDGGQLADRHD